MILLWLYYAYRNRSNSYNGRYLIISEWFFSIKDIEVQRIDNSLTFLKLIVAFQDLFILVFNNLLQCVQMHGRLHEWCPKCVFTLCTLQLLFLELFFEIIALFTQCFNFLFCNILANFSIRSRGWRNPFPEAPLAFSLPLLCEKADFVLKMSKTQDALLKHLKVTVESCYVSFHNYIGYVKRD